MAVVGRLLRGLRASEDRSPLAGPELVAPPSIKISSTSFAQGRPIPRVHAGAGVGDNVSPELQWSGVPNQARQLVLLMDDVDVPFPKPLVHSIAVLEPQLSRLAEGEFREGTAGLRMISTLIGRRGYAGPRPVPGHGPHRYRFHLLALDRRLPDDVSSAKRLLAEMGGHVIARGMLTGTYER